MQVYYFPGSDNASVSDVGGKAYSLINMCQAGLPVPPGLVLSVEFFESWIWQLKHTDEWQVFKKSKMANIAKATARFKEIASGFAFDDEQRMCLDELYNYFSKDCVKSMFAVRSSSPEEDLEGASFAGGYETLLGVTLEGLERAILHTFCSCFDERIFRYKKAQGISVFDSRIAVIIQEQVNSDVAGVAFSVNPLNNCYDEIVVNANWGLGESIVSGQVSPDHFIVDKNNGTIVDKVLGSKEVKVSLTETGGTSETKATDAREFSLSDKQVTEIASITSEVESLYEIPVDIEWAISREKVYLLQARPVTTCIPLPAGMITENGCPKLLYLDITLCVQGIRKPLSVMGLDWLKQLVEGFSEHVFGTNLVNTTKPEDSLFICKGGRLYVNLTNILYIFGKERFCSLFRRMDNLAVDIIENIDETEYLTTGLSPNLKHVKAKLVNHIPDTLAKIIGGTLIPGTLKKSYDKSIRKLQHQLDELLIDEMSLEQYLEASLFAIIKMIVHGAVPVVATAERAKAKLNELFQDESDEVSQLIEDINCSLPGNVTVEMGLELYHLATSLDSRPSTLDELIDLIESGEVSYAFQAAWKTFLKDYGFRGPSELDLAAPRYHDNANMLLEQLLQYLVNENNDINPEDQHEACQKQRHIAYEALMKIAHDKGWLTCLTLHRLFKTVEILGGLRETHKYHLIKANCLFREKVLAIADGMVANDLLKNRDDIFNLTVADLMDAQGNPKKDLQKCIFDNTEFLNHLTHIKSFPAVIDSRGKVLQAKPRECNEGEIKGQGVSRGVAIGTVKVLENPHEKAILPGDVLVTKATDPGWTPLFINAAAIVLEVGGVLQHGALVAREYGKPCVVGIQDVMSQLKDGQQVEVDGSNGIIRIL